MDKFFFYIYYIHCTRIEMTTSIAIMVPLVFLREPSEVIADGQVFCYDADNNGWGIAGNILVQFLDDHHLRVENQTGTCSTNEYFENPVDFER